MQTEPVPGPRYTVRISRHEADAFGWEISRKSDSIEVHRSTRLFSTRVEAILDSARAAATLRIGVIEPSVEGENQNGGRCSSAVPSLPSLVVDVQVPAGQRLA